MKLRKRYQISAVNEKITQVIESSIGKALIHLLKPSRLQILLWEPQLGHM